MSTAGSGMIGDVQYRRYVAVCTPPIRDRAAPDLARRPAVWSSDGRGSPRQGPDIREVRLQRLDDLGRPRPRVDALVPLLDLAAAVDDHADARRALLRVGVGAVGGADRPVGVTDQRKVEVELLGEL